MAYWSCKASSAALLAERASALTMVVAGKPRLRGFCNVSHSLKSLKGGLYGGLYRELRLGV